MRGRADRNSSRGGSRTHSTRLRGPRVHGRGDRGHSRVGRARGRLGGHGRHSRVGRPRGRGRRRRSRCSRRSRRGRWSRGGRRAFRASREAHVHQLAPAHRGDVEGTQAGGVHRPLHRRLRHSGRARHAHHRLEGLHELIGGEGAWIDGLVTVGAAHHRRTATGQGQLGDSRTREMTQQFRERFHSGGSPTAAVRQARRGGNSRKDSRPPRSRSPWGHAPNARRERPCEGPSRRVQPIAGVPRTTARATSGAAACRTSWRPPWPPW